MDDSLSSWLAAREPADTAARSASLTRRVAEAIATVGPIRVLDLATGTGANLRYLSDRFATHQQWLVVDGDVELLGHLPNLTSTWAQKHGHVVEGTADGFAIRGEGLDCHVSTRHLDLRALDATDIFDGRHLVTASALLDLVSKEWLRTLAERCRTAGAAVLFALSYDGRASCSPEEPEDDIVRALMNLHQLRDKGLGGPAAGPEAWQHAVQAFGDQGYEVQSEQTDWMLGPADGELQRRLIEGWATAAIELTPEHAPAITAWLQRRLSHIRKGRSEVVVGHHDVAAWLPR